MARRICPVEGKAIYPNRLECDLAIVSIQSTNKHHRRRKYREEPSRSYFCGHCHGWHFTSQTKSKVESSGKG